MQIRTKIAIQFTIIIASILIIFSLAIYYTSENFRKQEFYKRLNDRAIQTAKLLKTLKITEKDKKKLRDANKTILTKLNAEKVLMFNEKDELVYASYEADSILFNPEFLTKVRKRKNVETSDWENQVIGTMYEDEEGKSYVVIASASDTYGKEKLQNILNTLIISFVIGISLTVFLGIIFAGQSLKPIAEINKEITNITAYNLKQKLNTGNNKDEIAHLALNFNQMLERLERSFELQKSFVSNASHELRTPLAAIKSEIQIALENNRSTDEYKVILRSLLTDNQRLIQLTNGLLQLAKSENKDNSLILKSTRVDELLFKAQEEVLSQNNNYKIMIDFDDIPDDDGWVSTNGNEALLLTVFTNLLENACKYSPKHEAEAKIRFNEKHCIVAVKDNGIGIPQSELSKIFEPFYRTQNASTYRGYGIGLSVCRRIIDMHQGKIEVTSEEGKGSTFEVTLPHL
ncbi:Adaptive-response sensory-kinase SasA [Emticicia aquatica]|jgi:signal transduction histidine kinase|uniref:histidine kinase n=1 Tax=Emticicia aquatica TaxID=1681835 RepID=A0ABM9AL60_9BACT|nr:HAMP domain-containing sensor histidine kinase [Emticicia aquatica]CAH0994470.1 Adaptive-response sensory-kinase SasA [Emticicia aquatica]